MRRVVLEFLLICVGIYAIMGFIYWLFEYLFFARPLTNYRHRVVIYACSCYKH